MTSAEELQAQRIADDILTTHAHRRRRTRWAVVGAAAAVVAIAVPAAVALSGSSTNGSTAGTGSRGGRTAGSSGGTAPGGTASGRTAPGRTASGGQTAISDEARIYAAVLLGRPHPDRGDGAATPTYVIDRFCTGMIEIESGKRGPCGAGPISRDLQRQIRRVGGNRVVFRHVPPAPGLHTTVVRIGTATISADHAQVPIDVLCGPLCGEGETANLVHSGVHWRVTGSGGYAWIS